MCLWSTATAGEPLASAAIGTEATSLAWHPTGGGVAAGTADGRVVFLDLA